MHCAKPGAETSYCHRHRPTGTTKEYVAEKVLAECKFLIESGALQTNFEEIEHDVAYAVKQVI